MKKSTENAVKKAIGLEFGVKADQIFLMESHGNIEQLNSFNCSEETFSFVVKTSEHINLGFIAQVDCCENAYTNKRTYEVDPDTIEKNEAFTNYL